MPQPMNVSANSVLQGVSSNPTTVQYIQQPQQPVVPTGDTTTKQETNPLAEFDNLWKAPTQTGDQTKQIQQAIPFNSDKAAEALQKRDYISNIVTPELFAKMQSDYPSFQQGLNTVLQAFAHDMYSTVFGAVNQGFETHGSSMKQELSGNARTNYVRQSVMDKLAGIPDAVRPPALALMDQFIKANPNATPDEVHKNLQKYFQSMANTFGGTTTPSTQMGQQPTGTNQTTSGTTDQTDWLNFIGQNAGS